MNSQNDIYKEEDIETLERKLNILKNKYNNLDDEDLAFLKDFLGEYDPFMDD